MQTLEADGSGELFAGENVFRGRSYSLYLAKSPDTPPAAGTVALYHEQEDGSVDPILDNNGLAVVIDFATADGAAPSFIAHGSRVNMSGDGLGAGSTLRFSLLPLR